MINQKLNTMKKLIVIAILLLTVQLQAQVKIGSEEAFSTAQQFVSQQGKGVGRTLTLSEEIKSRASGQTNLYVFLMEPKGFVIVSATNEILAYSFGSAIPVSEALPPHIAYWLDLYNEQTDYLLQHPDRIKKPAKQEHSVGPLLTSVWGQGCYHNSACPADASGPCHHVSAGCVAIAMAQIMYYHKQPQKGNGSVSYTCQPYGTLSANFGNTTYQWEDMVDTVSESNPAVAKLVSHCGISVEMNYGAQTSIASISAAHNALQRHFFYPLSVNSSRSLFTDEEWTAMIRQDIEDLRPVYYSGKSNLGSHAFVCDGYDNNGLFHFNFGWDGVADGYYTIDNPYGFSTIQSCIHNITPLANFPIQSDNNGIIYVSPDGCGNGSSWENATSDLQTAIYKSNVDKYVIWVKEGTYTRETTDGHAFNSFGFCRMYGGFKGDEPFDYDLSLRDFEAHPSILDGNQSNGVLSLQFATNTVIIDGFTLQNGMAAQGGGIHAKCQTCIRNCKFFHNYSRANGGGLSQQSTSSVKTIIEDCEFWENEAMGYGGAVYDAGNSTYRRCLIHDNRAQLSGGGVYCNDVYNPGQFVNCTFNNNTAKNGGGVATNHQGTTFWSCLINNNTAETGGGCHFKKSANLFNCTIVKNEAQLDYGGVYSSILTQDGIQNCILWGNVSAGENCQIGMVTYSHCAVENDWSETGQNYNAESDNDGRLPRFYVRFQNPNATAGAAGRGGDWRLQPNSLCINKGSNILNQPTTDLGGTPRCLHGKTDLGAYEADVATHGITAYLCEEDPYYYQDSALLELGFYTFYYPSTPYDSLVIVDVRPPEPTIYLSEEICSNETYDFFGTLLNETGVYTNTENCITYHLSLRITPLTIVYMQEETCDGNPFDFFGDLLYEEGHYSTTIDCKTYELDLTVYPSSQAEIMEEEICEGEVYDFFGRQLRNSGHYFTTIQCTDYQLDLTTNPAPPLRCSNDTIIPYGTGILLTATGADSYLWSTGDTTASITVYPKTDCEYTVTGFSQKGCSSNATVKVKVTNDTDEFVMYPNPADKTIEIDKPLIDEVEVFNLLGAQIDRIDAHRDVVVLDVSQYEIGMYIVHVRCLNNHYYKKLVIQH